MSELEDSSPDDPFSPQMSPKLSLVVQMRIYDVLMAILSEENFEAADKLNRLHASGKIWCSLPFLDLEEEDSSESDQK